METEESKPEQTKKQDPVAQPIVPVLPNLQPLGQMPAHFLKGADISNSSATRPPPLLQPAGRIDPSAATAADLRQADRAAGLHVVEVDVGKGHVRVKSEPEDILAVGAVIMMIGSVVCALVALILIGMGKMSEAGGKTIVLSCVGGGAIAGVISAIWGRRRRDKSKKTDFTGDHEKVTEAKSNV